MRVVVTWQFAAKVLLAAVLTAAGVVVAVYAPNRGYPACDNTRARHELDVLYDNRRLLHAVKVSDLRLRGDSMFARHCAATVTWADGSVSVVTYDFNWSGRGSPDLDMWINYNGGMLGPPLF